MNRFICFFLSMAILASISGYTGTKNKTETNSSQAGIDVTGRIDNIIQKFESGEKIDLTISDELDKADEKGKLEILADFADDMAKARFFGFTDSEIIAMAGKVVKEYPQPLLLNNYAALLTETAPEDSLYLLLQALEKEPGDPIILSNIANMYIQLDDFEAAERYAKEALASAPDFGPAYQVLTTCHLKNGNSILASETMVKSAKYCFNDLSEFQFQSFLDAVKQLNPQKDEYPLKEEFIKELYEIAKTNVDTMDVSQSVDTPEAQLTIMELPSIGSADDLRSYYSYFTGEQQKIQDSYNESQIEYNECEQALEEEKNKESGKEGLVYHVDKNLRQKYAIEVLRSFYIFKADKLKLNAEDGLNAIANELDKKDKDIIEKYEKLKSDNEEEVNKLSEELGKALEAQNAEQAASLMEKIEKANVNTVIHNFELDAEKENEVLRAEKESAEKSMVIVNGYYKEIKQTLEEYWLRTGGMMKYLTEENVFNLYDAQRRMDVDNYILFPFDRMNECARRIDDQYMLVRVAEDNLAAYKSQAEANAREVEEQRSGNGLVPNKEKGVISTYPEKNVLGDIGAEFDLFGVLGASAQYDGEDYSLEVSLKYDGLKQAVGGKTVTDKKTEKGKTVVTVSKEAYYTIGVDASINLAGMMSIGGSATVSRFNTMCNKNGMPGITDSGIITSIEYGAQNPIGGVTDQTTIRRSSMTGIAIKNKSIKYKFAFLTYTVPNN